jgi:hypothetical protein
MRQVVGQLVSCVVGLILFRLFAFLLSRLVFIFQNCTDLSFSARLGNLAVVLERMVAGARARQFPCALQVRERNDMGAVAASQIRYCGPGRMCASAVISDCQRNRQPGERARLARPESLRLQNKNNTRAGNRDQRFGRVSVACKRRATVHYLYAQSHFRRS